MDINRSHILRENQIILVGRSDDNNGKGAAQIDKVLHCFFFYSLCGWWMIFMTIEGIGHNEEQYQITAIENLTATTSHDDVGRRKF